jgi:hypothetical protein
MTERPVDPGVAGGSADREYQRRADARKRRIEGRFGPRLGRFFLAITDEPHSTKAWARGAQGEREVARILSGIPGVHHLNDRHVRGQRQNIDHIAVGPGGVFVIDAKNYRGMIRVRDMGGLFRTDERLFVGGRDRSKVADGLAWQVAAVESVIAPLGLSPAPRVTPVLCFVNGDWPLFRPPSKYKGVRLEGTNSIKKLLVAEPALDQEAVSRVVRALAEALPA